MTTTKKRNKTKKGNHIARHTVKYIAQHTAYGIDHVWYTCYSEYDRPEDALNALLEHKSTGAKDAKYRLVKCTKTYEVIEYENFRK